MNDHEIQSNVFFCCILWRLFFSSSRLIVKTEAYTHSVGEDEVVGGWMDERKKNGRKGKMIITIKFNNLFCRSKGFNFLTYINDVGLQLKRIHHDLCKKI